jgi:large subunit ribosomal protein L18
MKHSNISKRARRHKRIRSRVAGTAERPRLAVFKSNKFIYAQIIDDIKAVTLCSASDIKNATGTKTSRAEAVGKTIAEAAKKQNITTVVFDRGGFRFTGRVKTLADSARSHGLVF